MTPKVSIVIPCYNMGTYIHEALEPVLTYPNQNELEIIVVNDGSDDDGFTKSVLDSFNIPNLQIIHQENKGLGIARNVGFAMAKAPFIIPLDADNKIRDIYLDKAIYILESNPEIGIVYGDLIRFGTKQNRVCVGAFDISKIIIKNYIDACVVIRKKAWESVRGYDEKMPIMGYEDWDLHLRLFLKGWQFYYIDKVCFEYRVREDAMLVNSNRNRSVLLDYIFSKPENSQLKLLRDKLLEHEYYQKELFSIQKRKVPRLALKLEKPIKAFFRLFKFHR